MSNQIIRRVEGSERQRTFLFIQHQFAEHFAAVVEDDTEELYAVMDETGNILAAFGLNRDPARFFSRHYIGDASAVRDTAFTAADTQRPGHIVELSHLCVRRPATLCRLIAPLAQFLAQKADYLVCTVTRNIADLFERKGLASYYAADARVEQLPPGKRDGWGDYYTYQPVVLLGKLSDACQALMPATHPTEALRHSA